EIAVAAHQSLLLVDQGGLRMVLIGPGRAELPRDGTVQEVRLHAGRLAVSSADAPVAIESSGARVTVRAHAMAEIELCAVEPRVAVYAGVATVEWREVRHTIEARAGTALTPRGTGQIEEQRRAEVETLLAPTRATPRVAAPILAAAPGSAPVVAALRAPRPAPIRRAAGTTARPVARAPEPRAVSSSAPAAPEEEPHAPAAIGVPSAAAMEPSAAPSPPPP